MTFRRSMTRPTQDRRSGSSRWRTQTSWRATTIRVTHSTVNYKDGLALSGSRRSSGSFPMVLGVDLAGVVETSLPDCSAR